MQADGWTIKEAARALRINVPFRTFQTWVQASLSPIGVRDTEHPGRPPFVYDRAALRALYRRKTAPDRS